MSGKVGQIYVAREKRARFLDVMPEGCMEISDATAELIDNEVRDIIHTEYARALEILKEKRKVLQNGAKVLLEKEKIEGGELKALMELTS
jgi:cell division protease FtsH